MLINADAKQLEWRAVLHLSGDKTGIQEVLDGVDFHSENQKRFQLPPKEEGRLIAKIFLFRAIFKGSAYAYSVDPLFSHLGGEKYWQRVIDAFYEKYTGIYEFHNKIINEVTTTGKQTLPTGVVWEYEPRLRKGEYEWPVTEIVNHPVQGWSAQVMAIIRVLLKSKLDAIKFKHSYLFSNTVHDSIVLDVDNHRDTWYNICIEINNAFKEVGKYYQMLFNEEMKVPMAAEITVGNNWKWMHSINIK